MSWSIDQQYNSVKLNEKAIQELLFLVPAKVIIKESYGGEVYS